MAGNAKYCSRCGAELAEGAAFCSKCGASTTGAQAAPAPTPAREYRHEKQEKHEKHEKHEKGRGGDISGAIVGGLILIWLGTTFYLQETGDIPETQWWAYFILGIGVIIIVQGLIRYAQSRRPFVGSIIGGAVLALIGISFVTTSTTNFWPLILVVIGIAVLVSAVAGRRRTPPP